LNFSRSQFKFGYEEERLWYENAQFGFNCSGSFLLAEKSYVFQKEKNIDGAVAYLRLSGQDRSDGAVGSAK